MPPKKTSLSESEKRLVELALARTDEAGRVTGWEEIATTLNDEKLFTSRGSRWERTNAQTHYARLKEAGHTGESQYSHTVESKPESTLAESYQRHTVPIPETYEPDTGIVPSITDSMTGEYETLPSMTTQNDPSMTEPEQQPQEPAVHTTVTPLSHTEIQELVAATLADLLPRELSKLLGRDDMESTQRPRGTGSAVEKRTFSLPLDISERLSAQGGVASSHVVKALRLYLNLVEQGKGTDEPDA